MALHAGQALLLMDGWNPRRALTLIDTHGVTSTYMVPSMFEALLALPDSARTRRPATLRAAIHGAAPCSITTKRAMLDWWGPVLVECYSSAELSGTYATADEWLAHPGTVGKPMPGVDIRVFDESHQPCPPGVEGLVFVSDSGARYHDDSRPSDAHGYATVGDVGWLDDDGWLFLTGRATDYISVGGAKFHPSEVEDVLREAPDVVDCGVAGMPQRRLGQVVGAAVVFADPSSADSAAYSRLLAFARARLSVSKVPQRIVAVTALPRDGYGKLRRQQVKELLAEGLQQTGKVDVSRR
jgi:long-chain acyl-CoA synthetase